MKLEEMNMERVPENKVREVTGMGADCVRIHPNASDFSSDRERKHGL